MPSESKPGELHMFTNDYDWVIATSAEDAATLYREHTGEGPGVTGHDADDWSTCSPDAMFSYTPDAGITMTRETFAHWIATHGRGYFASENY